MTKKKRLISIIIILTLVLSNLFVGLAETPAQLDERNQQLEENHQEDLNVLDTGEDDSQDSQAILEAGDDCLEELDSQTFEKIVEDSLDQAEEEDAREPSLEEPTSLLLEETKAEMEDNNPDPGEDPGWSYFKDFEDTEENSRPEDLKELYNGSGSANQKVIITQENGQENKVFKQEGRGGWASKQPIDLPQDLPDTYRPFYRYNAHIRCLARQSSPLQ